MSPDPDPAPVDGAPEQPVAPLSPAVVAGQAAAAAAEVEAALSVAPDPTAAAFFDIDNTVVRGASIFYLAMGLAQRKFFTMSDVVGFVRDQVKFRVGGEDMGDMASATETALGFVRGHEVAEVVMLGRDIFDEKIVGKVYPGTLAMARGHLDAGQRVWLVSAAPVELATIIAKRLGLTGALGTVSEIRGGVYTGNLVGRPLHGPAKAEAVRALAAREGLDLSRCAAYSDSSNDIPMLSLVGDPCAVNPDSTLRNHARDLDWRIVDYRTGRKAAKIGVPALATAGLVAGIAVGAVAFDRRRRTRSAN
ncbi:MAG TPA: HAD-IB family hydrolase [Candidatus Limnocylindria bacterium]|nr:HAD-IB family hydrolase [Candidatus Limnocylindria bacterium]